MIGAVGNFERDAIVEAAATMSECRTATHEHARTCAHDPSSGWTHRDGWGAAYLNAAKNLECFRDPASYSPESARRALAGASPGLVVIHARKASDPAKQGIAYTHPIECRLGDHPGFFFHNGWVPDAFRLLGRKDSAWDTQELLDWLMPAFESGDRVAALRDRLEALPATTTSANFLLLEPAQLTVCNWFSKTSETPEYYTMYRLENADATFVSSEPISSLAPVEKWQPVGNRSIFSIAST